MILFVYGTNYLPLDNWTFIIIVFIYKTIYSTEHMMCQDFNWVLKYRMKFKFNYKIYIYIYIKIIRCKIMRLQKFMWKNIIKSTES